MRIPSVHGLGLKRFPPLFSQRRLCLTVVILVTMSAFVGGLEVSGQEGPTGNESELIENGTAKDSTVSILSVGVSKYNSLPPLEFTASDARRFVQAYRDVGLVADENISLLVDDADEQTASIESVTLQAKIKGFLQSQNRDSTVVFFFSGHGFMFKEAFYLATSDFSVEDPATTGISLESLRLGLADCPAKSKIVILDCCHSGAFSAASRDIAAALRSVPGCVAITASRPDQPSRETAELQSGVFTYWLVRGLRGAANSKVDDQIDATELFGYVSAQVKESTDSDQLPTIAFDQSSEIPTVIELKRPDRPSGLVGVIAFPLPPSPEIFSNLLDTISRFPEANPRRTIGLCHWVLKHAESGSAEAKQAMELIAKIDSLILTGKTRLGAKEEGEQ